MDERNRRIEQALRLEAAFNEIGLSFYTDDWLAKVLAFAYCFPQCEDVVTNAGLNFAVRCAQKRFNIEEGETPDLGKLPLLMKYINEIKRNGENIWLKDIYERYGIKP